MENVTCGRCGTKFPWDEGDSHLHEESVSFNDGCTFVNDRCIVSGVWWWDRAREDGNPHGHEFPAHWVRKNQPDALTF